MSEKLLEATLQKPAMAQAIGCLGSIPIILSVFVAVNLFIGESELPPEVRGTTPYFVLATLLTGALAAYVWKRSRIRLAVVDNQGERFLEIYDPAAPLVVQADGLQLAYGVNTFHMPRTGNMTLLIVGVFQDGELVVSFTETWGSVYTPPAGWPRDFSLEGHVARAAYTGGGRSFLPQLVELLEA